MTSADSGKRVDPPLSDLFDAMFANPVERVLRKFIPTWEPEPVLASNEVRERARTHVSQMLRHVLALGDDLARVRPEARDALLQGYEEGLLKAGLVTRAELREIVREVRGE